MKDIFQEMKRYILGNERYILGNERYIQGNEKIYSRK